jgi:hypothetical protein
MKKLLIYIMFMLMIAVPVRAIDEFCGCMKRIPVDEPTTIGWTHDGVGTDGYELKIIHYFYDGIETEIVETTGLSYTFSEFPRSSRHFEVQVRAFENGTEGRKYSIWVSSTDKEYAVYNGEACGWLIYTVPGVPSW